MNENDILHVINNSWIMRNPMVRIPLEAYFREQFAKKEQELNVRDIEHSYWTYFIHTSINDGENVRPVDYEWIEFLMLTIAQRPKMQKLEVMKRLADDYIDVTIKKAIAENVKNAKDIVDEAANNSATAFVISGVILATWMSVGSMLGHYVHPLITPVMMLIVVLTLRTQWFWDFLRRKCGANV